MGFDIFDINPAKAISRGLGLGSGGETALNVLFPSFKATQLFSQGVGKLAGAFTGTNKATAVSPGVQTIHLEGSASQSSVPQNVFFSGSGGSYLENSYDPFGGPPPWDYSTPSPHYSTPQYQEVTYSQPVSMSSDQRTWEDLASLVPLFL